LAIVRTIEVSLERKDCKDFNTKAARFGVSVELEPGDNAQEVFDHWTGALKAQLAATFPRPTAPNTTTHGG
jgi:hypothetical protein